MRERLRLTVRWQDEVSKAESDARKLAKLTGFDSLGATAERWIETFGDTEPDLEEYLSYLARRYRDTSVWKRKDRRTIIQRYISVHAILTVAHGLETVWR